MSQYQGGITLGRFGSAAAVIGAILLQGTTLNPDNSTLKEIGNYLIPFNTAFVALMWWRVTQLEKAQNRMDLKVDALQSLVDRSLGSRLVKRGEV